MSISAFAQILQTTFKAGANYSTVHNENLIDNKYLVGTEFGFSRRFPLNEGKAGNLYLQSEILFSRRGYKQLYKSEELQIKFSYLSFPVTVVYRPIDFLSLEAGMEYNFLVRAKWDDGRDRIKVTKNYKRSDWGLVGGVTFLENKQINIFFRYVHGLKNILHYPDINEFGVIKREIRDFNNRSFQLGIKINIPGNR